MNDETTAINHDTASAEVQVTHLLDREAPPAYLQEWTTRIAAPAEVKALVTASVVVFRLGQEWFALPSDVFQEVAEPATIHSIPHRRNGALLGVVNVRGELTLCVALPKVLGLVCSAGSGASGRTIYQRLLVVNNKGNRLAFPVDEVSGVRQLNAHDLMDVPATLAKTASSYIKGLLPWQDKMVGCIEDGALFTAINRSFT